MSNIQKGFPALGSPFSFIYYIYVYSNKNLSILCFVTSVLSLYNRYTVC